MAILILSRGWVMKIGNKNHLGPAKAEIGAELGNNIHYTFKVLILGKGEVALRDSWGFWSVICRFFHINYLIFGYVCTNGRFLKILEGIFRFKPFRGHTKKL